MKAIPTPTGPPTGIVTPTMAEHLPIPAAGCGCGPGCGCGCQSGSPCQCGSATGGCCGGH